MKIFVKNRSGRNLKRISRSVKHVSEKYVYSLRTFRMVLGLALSVVPRCRVFQDENHNDCTGKATECVGRPVANIIA